MWAHLILTGRIVNLLVPYIGSILSMIEDHYKCNLLRLFQTLTNYKIQLPYYVVWNTTSIRQFGFTNHIIPNDTQYPMLVIFYIMLKFKLVYLKICIIRFHTDTCNTYTCVSCCVSVHVYNYIHTDTCNTFIYMCIILFFVILAMS